MVDSRLNVQSDSSISQCSVLFYSRSGILGSLCFLQSCRRKVHFPKGIHSTECTPRTGDFVKDQDCVSQLPQVCPVVVKQLQVFAVSVLIYLTIHLKMKTHTCSLQSLVPGVFLCVPQVLPFCSRHPSQTTDFLQNKLSSLSERTVYVFLKDFSPVAETHSDFLILATMSSGGRQVFSCGRLHPPELSVPLQQECVKQQCLPVIRRRMILGTLMVLVVFSDKAECSCSFSL